MKTREFWKVCKKLANEERIDVLRKVMAASEKEGLPVGQIADAVRLGQPATSTYLAQLQNECGLFIGNIYGGGHITDYTPNDPDIRSPKVMVLNATVGGPTSDLPIIGNTGNDTIYEGNVFGGGYYGHVTCNPEVIIGNGTDQSLVNIEGNVYGGGKQGSVNGNADVVIVPHTHQFTYSQPATGGVIRVIDSKGLPVPAGTTLTFGEHLDLKIEAIPSVYGYGFDEWTVTGTGASVTNPNSVSTVFTMGTENASVATTFITKLSI